MRGKQAAGDTMKLGLLYLRTLRTDVSLSSDRTVREGLGFGGHHVLKTHKDRHLLTPECLRTLLCTMRLQEQVCVLGVGGTVFLRLDRLRPSKNNIPCSKISILL